MSPLTTLYLDLPTIRIAYREAIAALIPVCVAAAD
jgi:hypothetical protein